MSHAGDVGDDVFPVVELQLTSSGQAQEAGSSSQDGERESVRVNSTELFTSTPDGIVSLYTGATSTVGGLTGRAALAKHRRVYQRVIICMSRILLVQDVSISDAAVTQLTTHQAAVAVNDVNGAECIVNFSSNSSSSSTQSLETRLLCCTVASIRQYLIHLYHNDNESM